MATRNKKQKKKHAAVNVEYCGSNKNESNKYNDDVIYYYNNLILNFIICVVRRCFVALCFLHNICPSCILHSHRAPSNDCVLIFYARADAIQCEVKSRAMHGLRASNGTSTYVA